MQENSNARIETELEVKTYIDHLKYTLENGAKIVFHFAERPFTDDMFPYKK